MELIVLGSSSRGNGYALIDKQGDALILECGVKFKEMQKALDFEVFNISAALISHEHLDHSRYVEQYLKYGVDVYAPIEVFKRHEINHHRAKKLDPLRLKKAGPYTFQAFEVEHDVKTFGFMVRHWELGLMVFATDTYFLPFTFKDVNHWVIEANYDQQIMDDKASEADENMWLRNRIMKSHMSIDNLVKMLKANDLKETKNIVITHLSDRNSHEVNFMETLKKNFGVPVYAADTGVRLNLNRVPF